MTLFIQHRCNCKLKFDYPIKIIIKVLSLCINELRKFCGVTLLEHGIQTVYLNEFVTEKLK